MDLLQIIGFINFFFLQWFFVRICVEIKQDNSYGRIGFVGFVVPMTGWFGTKILPSDAKV